MSLPARDPGPTRRSKLPNPGILLGPQAKGRGVRSARLPEVSHPQRGYARASPGCQARSRCSRAPRRPSHWAGGAVRLGARCAPAPHIPRPHSLEVEAAAVPVSAVLRLTVAHEAGRARAWRQNAQRRRQRRRGHGCKAVSLQEPSQLWTEGACAEVRTRRFASSGVLSGRNFWCRGRRKDEAAGRGGT